jgi:hypothetical protein
VLNNVESFTISTPDVTTKSFLLHSRNIDSKLPVKKRMKTNHVFSAGNFTLHVRVFCLYLCKNHGKRIACVEVKLRILKEKKRLLGYVWKNGKKIGSRKDAEGNEMMKKIESGGTAETSGRCHLY